jgi:hypothetical protein
MKKLFVFALVLFGLTSCIGIGAFEVPLDDYCYKPEFEPKTYVWPFVRKQQPPTIRPSFSATPPRQQGRIGRPNTPTNGKGGPRGRRR